MAWHGVASYLHDVQHEDSAVAAVVLAGSVLQRAGPRHESLLPRLVSVAELAHQVLLDGLCVENFSDSGGRERNSKEEKTPYISTKYHQTTILHTQVRTTNCCWSSTRELRDGVYPEAKAGRSKHAHIN